MRHARLASFLLPAVLLALPLGAQDVINFHEYSSPVTTEYQAAIGAPLSSNGLDFYQAIDFDANNRNAIGTWGTSDPGSPNIPVNVGTSTTVFGTALAGEIDIFKTGSDVVFGNYLPFSIFSMDVAHLYSNAYSSITLSSFTMRIYAFNSTSTFFQDFLINLSPADQNGIRTPMLQTLTFDSRFQDVLNVYWNQGSGSGTATQFTNVVASTPEPSSLALMGTGLVGLGGVFRRRRRGVSQA